LKLFKKRIETRLALEKKYSEQKEVEWDNFLATLPIFPNKTKGLTFHETKYIELEISEELRSLKINMMTSMTQVGQINHVADLTLWYQDFEYLLQKLELIVLKLESFMVNPQMYINKNITEQHYDFTYDKMTVTLYRDSGLDPQGRFILKVESPDDLPKYFRKWRNLMGILNLEYFTKLTLVDIILISINSLGFVMTIGTITTHWLLRKRIRKLEQILEPAPARIFKTTADPVNPPQIRETIIRPCVSCHQRSKLRGKRLRPTLPSNLPSNMSYNEKKRIKLSYITPGELPSLYAESDIDE
jgi:hypothetical protein